MRTLADDRRSRRSRPRSHRHVMKLSVQQQAVRAWVKTDRQVFRLFGYAGTFHHCTTMTTPNWSAQQQRALDDVGRWLKSGDAPAYYLAGYAGTGKTTLARHLAEGAGHVLFAAFTGKAASVMRSKGCHNASTIHQLIYEPKERSRRKLRELRAELVRAEFDDAPADAIMRLRKECDEEARRVRTPAFEVRQSCEVNDADLVVIDECSMVGEQLGRDLLSFGTKVLVLGDPAQLPPVKSGGFFTNAQPDTMLTEVHRQAKESGILRLATELREGRPFTAGTDYGNAKVITRDQLDPNDVPNYGQAIVGRNATRRGTNARMRQLLGHGGHIPHIGERVICLRNNHDLGLLNGEQYNVLDACDLGDSVGLTVEANDIQTTVQAHAAPFRGEELGHWDHDRDMQEFDWAYVVTCHKSQGSEWPSVIVFDESHVFGQHAARWRYTAATRAADHLTVVEL